ncbi:MAG: hypothetical protein WBB39_05185, partial [Candidatus Saccharimonadales bacterium]
NSFTSSILVSPFCFVRYKTKIPELTPWYLDYKEETLMSGWGYANKTSSRELVLLAGQSHIRQLLLRRQ